MAQRPATTLSDHLRLYNNRLDDQLQRRIGVSVETYKIASFVFRAVGIIVMSVAMFLPTVDPQPMTVLVFGAFVLGPDVVEAYLTRET